MHYRRISQLFKKIAEIKCNLNKKFAENSVIQGYCPKINAIVYFTC